MLRADLSFFAKDALHKPYLLRTRQQTAEQTRRERARSFLTKRRTMKACYPSSSAAASQTRLEQRAAPDAWIERLNSRVTYLEDSRWLLLQPPPRHQNPFLFSQQTATSMGSTHLRRHPWQLPRRPQLSCRQHCPALSTPSRRSPPPCRLA
ncbi:uncharacterized protein IWZ02DRAFT_162342 [Phyllosticta citriasiana]|uniref:Uncharacterized protein n=1 Tax=Phyllosticta citriasiana TaxID=595635 RepID=A0ABR1K7C3_9PEZI